MTENINYSTRIKESFLKLLKSNKVDILEDGISVVPDDNIVTITVDVSKARDTEQARKGIELINTLMTDPDTGPLVFTMSEGNKHHFTMPNGPESLQKIKLVHENSVIVEASEILREANGRTPREKIDAEVQVKKMFEPFGTVGARVAMRQAQELAGLANVIDR